MFTLDSPVWDKAIAIGKQVVVDADPTNQLTYAETMELARLVLERAEHVAGLAQCLDAAFETMHGPHQFDNYVVALVRHRHELWLTYNVLSRVYAEDPSEELAEPIDRMVDILEDIDTALCTDLSLLGSAEESGLLKELADALPGLEFPPWWLNGHIADACEVLEEDNNKSLRALALELAGEPPDPPIWEQPKVT